jgi:hypothetical protein
MHFFRSMVLVGSVVLLLCACGSAPPPAPSDLTVTLRWVRGYSGDSKQKIEVGLMWALSFLGARFPDDAPKAFIWHDNLVTVDLDRVGLPQNARPAWEQLIANLNRSDEDRRMGGVDIGRFLMLTLCSPHAYYRLTGVESHFDQFRSRHTFESEQMAVVQSLIARGNRLIEIGAATNLSQIAFIGYEGTGTFGAHTFEKREIEAIEFMDNGQLRFALYDLQGNLKSSATAALTSAGKPSKCLWCHEIRLQPAFKNVTDIPGFHTTRDFDALIAERMKLVDRYRAGLHSKVDFKRTQDHTFAELPYLTFMEPSAERLSVEWNLPVEEVVARLKGKPTHKQEEFAWLGDTLYRRADVDALAPYPVIKVATDPREPSDYEPDLVGGDNWLTDAPPSADIIDRPD